MTTETKTKWQQMLDATKGGLEYNPTQSFALQVYWVVRSPTAAKEMIERGFVPCGKATMRDTPTTLVYLFRISRDQTLAAKLKSEVKTIGQHPHYQPALKSLEMNIPKAAVEMKLRQGGIDVSPLSWGPEEPILGHEIDLDFDPVVLECTEVYLDNRSFYQHSASRDWMKEYPEIIKPSRSLKPTTYCLGHPTGEIWSNILEPTLKAICFDSEENKQVISLEPGVFFHPFQSNKQHEFVFFLEFDLVVQKENIPNCRSHLSSIQKELEAPCMLILPTNVQNGKEEDGLEVRLMLSFPYSTGISSPTLGLLKAVCDRVEGQVIVFDAKHSDTELSHQEDPEATRRRDAVQHFLDEADLKEEKICILDGHAAKKTGNLAGYPLHPYYSRLIPDEKFEYKP